MGLTKKQKRLKADKVIRRITGDLFTKGDKVVYVLPRPRLATFIDYHLDGCSSTSCLIQFAETGNSMIVNAKELSLFRSGE